MSMMLRKVSYIAGKEKKQQDTRKKNQRFEKKDNLLFLLYYHSFSYFLYIGFLYYRETYDKAGLMVCYS